MAQRIVYRLEDDLDHSEAAETIVFGLDSVSYEIDLSEGNAAKLRDLLAPYVAVGPPNGRQAQGSRPAACRRQFGHRGTGLGGRERLHRVGPRAGPGRGP